MKRLILGSLVHGLPALVVLGLFVIGHKAATPDLSALEALRETRSSAARPTDPATDEGRAQDATFLAGEAPFSAEGSAATAVEPTATSGREGTAALSPVYRYFTFESPFAGNADARGSLFTMEIALTTWQSPLVADLFLGRLLERQPTLRGLILAEIADVQANDLRSAEARAALAGRLREMLNDHLVERGEGAAISEVIIVSFVIT
jgi:flagellar basal body-associated protein FliL